METGSEDLLIERCRRLIEEKLGWGDSKAWDTSDYEQLSHKIQGVTGVSLSVATLKRIWGRVRYDSRPTATTLNTLARYLGYENWRAFNHSVNAPVKSKSQYIPRTHFRFGIFLALIIFLLAAGFAWRISVRQSNPDPSKFSFSSKKAVEVGVPNTVIFDYDASAASREDCVFVQQSWDARLRQRVEYQQKHHTSIYYFPGFFEAKLLVNNKVVHEHKLYIKTNGWLPLIEQNPVPVYLTTQEVITNEGMGVRAGDLQRYNVHLQPVTPWVAYYNVRQFDDLTSEDLYFKTRLRNDFRDGSGACQHSEVHLLFEGGSLVIPLSAPGCIAELNFMGKDGKKEDLTGLACDFSDWVEVTAEFKDNVLTVRVNNNSAFTFPITSLRLPFVGIAYRFQGMGRVHSVQVGRTNAKPDYEEEFAKPG